jgi:predicted N-acyltransferase
MNQTATLTVPKPDSAANMHYSFHRSISAAGADWDLAAPGHDMFLQRPFLSVLEAYPPIGMRFGYLVFYKNGAPVGVATCQIKYFKGDDSLNDLETPPRRDPCFFNGLAVWFKRWVAGMAAADILICGNMLLTGEHGYYFDYERISQEESGRLMEQALDEVVKIMSREGVKMPVILVKDIAPEHRDQGEVLVKSGFTEFDIQPNMVLDLPFKSFEAYLAAMSTKYRTRAKRAVKKLEGIEKKELTVEDVARELPNLYRLYREIARNAGFNMVDLNEQYLLGMKQHLQDQFQIFAYYYEGRLVAFYSTIHNHDELEAHFLGFEKGLNHDFQLYLNILYDIVKIGIAAGCERIVFARTALEIKSSVGATAHQLWCYLRHQNSIANKFAGTLLDYLKPVEEWLPRHPFKEEGH